MTVEAKTYCGFWMKSLWILKTVVAIIGVALMAAVAAQCERVCDEKSPGVTMTSEGSYRCNGKPLCDNKQRAVFIIGACVFAISMTAVLVSCCIRRCGSKVPKNAEQSADEYVQTAENSTQPAGASPGGGKDPLGLPV